MVKSSSPDTLRTSGKFRLAITQGSGNGNPPVMTRPKKSAVLAILVTLCAITGTKATPELTAKLDEGLKR